MKIRKVTLAVLVTAILLTSLRAQAQTFLVDTGAGATSSIGASSLFAAGSTNCSPQPGCALDFQYLAAQFTLTEAAAIDTIEMWFVSGSTGSVDVKIRENINGLPGTNGPPLFAAGSIYSKRYSGLPNFFNSPQWVSFGQYQAVLAPGTYWVTFEPVAGSQMHYSTGGQVPNPLPKYAFYSEGNNRWVSLGADTNANSRLGIRIRGTVFPGLAFGTATRTFLKGSTFEHHYDYDFIRSGSRDFAPRGVEGPALTSTWIMVIPGGYINGHAKLIENGLSAGAYAVTDGGCVPAHLCSAAAEGAGRGVAYRTFTNMSDQPVTRRFNALLEGSMIRAGRHAHAGIYVFSTTAFSDTILASGKTPHEFLLQRDDLERLREGTDLSLADLFPQTALLSSDLEFVDGPHGEVLHIPMSTDLITLNPQESVTVVFDLAVYAPQNGGINFGDTLKPAANFITDAFGAPAYDLVAIGPSAPAAPHPASVTLGPASGSTALGTPYSVTATVLATNGNPIANSVVNFAITSGPNAGLTQPVPTDSNGEAVLTYISGLLGTDTIAASIGTLQATPVTSAWTIGATSRLVVSPATASIAVGGTQAYTVEAFDGFNNATGDVTALATFGITPDGTCSGATCGAATAGPHTVTASYDGKSATAALSVTGGSTTFAFSGFFAPVDNAPVLNVVKAGSAIPVKFSLAGNQGLNVLAAGFPVSQAIACDAGAPVDAITETVTAGSSSLSYDPLTDRYTYVWKTDKGWANTCRQLNVRLSDGTNHTANFRFSK